MANPLNHITPAKCTWVISNFRYKQNYCISQAFGAKSYQLQMDSNAIIYLTKQYNEYNDLMDLDDGADESALFYRISIVDKNGDKCHTQEGRANLADGNNLGHYILNRDYLLSKASILLPGGNLTIACEVFSYADDGVGTSGGLHELSRGNQGELFRSGKLADVVLVTDDGTEFKAHKLVLSLRSNVFSRMFINDNYSDDDEQSLKQSKRFTISNVSAEVFKDFLQYLYTGKCSLLSKNAEELYITADKFQVHSLKIVCEDHLETTLSLETVQNVLEFAELYHIENLKTKCLDYIVQNSNRINSESWNELTNEKPKLAFDLIQKIALKFKDLLKEPKLTGTRYDQLRTKTAIQRQQLYRY